ncbi:MAG: FkbM family methyltransferase [Bacillota bacterium]
MNSKAYGPAVVEVLLDERLARLTGKKSFEITGSLIDKSIIGAIKSSGTYEPHMLSLISELLPKGGVFVDVGANIGVLSIFAGLLLGDNGSVLSIEASPTNCMYLRENIRLNNCRIITAVNMGVWDCAAELTLSYVPEVAGCSFFSTTDVQEGIPEKVRCDTLDAILKQQGCHRVDLIKIDVEGAEIKALNGGREVFAKMRPRLLLEINLQTLQRFFDATLRDIYEAVSQYGYCIKLIHENGLPEEIGGYDALKGLFGRSERLDFLCEPKKFFS